MTPADEAARLDALRSYGILDTPPEEAFDDIAHLAAHICCTPVALITLVDEHRQWFKAHVGITEGATPRDVAFCAHNILDSDIMVVPDASKDVRFAGNPLVTGKLGIRFYAGAPLVAPSGHTLGSLCVIDTKPRELSDAEAAALRTLGRQVVAELELRRYALQVAAAFQERDLMARRLRDANEALETFAYTVAHDLRGPLRGIHQMAEMLLDDQGVAAEGAILARGMARESRRLARRIEALLAYARAGSSDANRVDVDLARMARRAFDVLKQGESDRVVELVAPESLRVRGDGVLLAEVVENLIENAWKYTAGRSPARVEIGATETDEGRAYFVKDNGSGFDMAEADKLFAAFQRLSTSGPGEGSGIGLATVARVVRRHGGTVWGEGAVGEGATFWFTLGDETSDEPLTS